MHRCKLSCSVHNGSGHCQGHLAQTGRGSLHQKKRGRRGRDHNLCSLVTPFLGSPCQRQLAENKQNKHCFDIIVQVCVSVGHTSKRAAS